MPEAPELLLADLRYYGECCMGPSRFRSAVLWAVAELTRASSDLAALVPIATPSPSPDLVESAKQYAADCLECADDQRRNHLTEMPVRYWNAMAADWTEAASELSRLRAENATLERERAELHRAILGGEPDYSMLSHKSFLEMVKLIDDARAGALGRALRAESALASMREALIDLVSECEEYARINHLHNADGSPVTTGTMKHYTILFR